MKHHRNNRGFTLVEILVVTAITVFITGILVANFARSRVDLNQTALLVTDAVREAQALALAGSTIGGTNRCGYGIHFLANGYLIYAGPNANPPTDCSTTDRNYNVGPDVKVREAFFSNNVIEVVLPAPDIFFEPPDPTTYIGGVNTPPTQTTIIIRRKGANCSGQSIDCRKINVTTSGLIQSQ